jgi:hypothetical protein
MKRLQLKYTNYIGFRIFLSYKNNLARVWYGYKIW